MILKILLLMAIVSISPPIKPGYLRSAMLLPVIEDGPDAECYGGAAYYEYVAREIHLCGNGWSANPIEYMGLLQHEVQHYYQFSYLPLPYEHETTWSKFLVVCAATVPDPSFAEDCARPNVAPSVILEIHATLPRYLGNDLPAELQSWYPWLDFG